MPRDGRAPGGPWAAGPATLCRQGRAPRTGGLQSALGGCIDRTSRLAVVGAVASPRLHRLTMTGATTTRGGCYSTDTQAVAQFGDMTHKRSYVASEPRAATGRGPAPSLAGTLPPRPLDGLRLDQGAGMTFRHPRGGVEKPRIGGGTVGLDPALTCDLSPRLSPAMARHSSVPSRNSRFPRRSDPTPTQGGRPRQIASYEADESRHGAAKTCTALIRGPTESSSHPPAFDPNPPETPHAPLPRDPLPLPRR